MRQKDTVVDHRSTMMNTANNNKVMRTDRVLTTYKKTTSPKQARRMEQMLISSFTLKYLQNAINSISRGKLSDFIDEYYAIIGMIESWADPE